jgi:hypothetical protein
LKKSAEGDGVGANPSSDLQPIQEGEAAEEYSKLQVVQNQTEEVFQKKNYGGGRSSNSSTGGQKSVEFAN